MAKSINDLVPENARKIIGKSSKLCPLSSHDILKPLKGDKVIIIACNARIKHVIPGIMRAAKELDAVISFELAKSEGNLKGGYTGMTPSLYSKIVFEYAEKEKFYLPFFVHGDHVTTKSPAAEVVEDSRALVKAELEAGYTSISIDASFNPNHDNVKISADLGKHAIDAGAGLEVEVGEILSTGVEARITSVQDAVEFLQELIEDKKIHPDFLAINNGAKHGNYKPGEEVHIDLVRTEEIHKAISKWGVVIAQHGITGTPLHLMGRFADCGIKKGNVATNWQNIGFACMPKDLMETMSKWAKDNKLDIKFATKEFKLNERNDMPAEYIKKVEEEAYKSAIEFLTAFRAKGTASKVINGLTK